MHKGAMGEEKKKETKSQNRREKKRTEKMESKNIPEITCGTDSLRTGQEEEQKDEGKGQGEKEEKGGGKKGQKEEMEEKEEEEEQEEISICQTCKFLAPSACRFEYYKLEKTHREYFFDRTK